MTTKPIDSATKILRKIQTELAAFRREVKTQFEDVKTQFDQVHERLDSIEQYLAGAIATATDARGIAEQLKLRMKRLEDRK